jgi:aminoglycoside phosphotransferase (APT) family kinase protein
MTASTTALMGLAVPELQAWLADHLPDASPPFAFTLIAGGHSNLTYLLEDSRGARHVLRRPPLGDLPAKAHDVAREYRIYAALGASAVPVPRVEVLCEDTTVIGAPFYVMQWVEGSIVDSPDSVASVLPTPALRQHATHSLVDGLTTLHCLNVDAIGLGELGRRENYVSRQLQRMQRVWEKIKTRELPLIDELHSRLAAKQPPQRYTGLVHSDYRLGNLMLDTAGNVAAVLDWELAALGDVLVDLGFLINSWDEPDDASPGVWMQEAPTRAGGFPDRHYLIERYAQRSGFDVSDLDYYRAFCYWRIAIVAEGIKRRYTTGALADDSINIVAVERRVIARAEHADYFLRQARA